MVHFRPTDESEHAPCGANITAAFDIGNPDRFPKPETACKRQNDISPIDCPECLSAIMEEIARKVKALEAERTANPKSVLDVNPHGSVTWSEVVHMIKDAGLWKNVVDTRSEFQVAYMNVK